MSRPAIRDLFQGRAIILAEDEINTDRIMPSKYLKELSFDVLGTYVFAGDRSNARARGETHAFDDPSNADAVVLLAGANFGAGSSREAAPQGLLRWGIQVVVAVSFGEIFRGNASTIGLPCLQIGRTELAAVSDVLAKDPSSAVTVDLRSLSLSVGDLSVPLTINERQRQMFLDGSWDTLSLLQESTEAATRVAECLPYLQWKA